MSDATKQSVERCKYRHEWYKVPRSETTNEYYVCRKCNHLAKGKEEKEAEAIVHLRSILKPGDTVYTVLRHVSRSGMTRGIDCYAMSVEPGFGSSDDLRAVPVWITSYVGHAIGSPQPLDYWRKSMGLKIGGCGMDMGFHVVYTLSRVLFHELDDKKDGGYALKHQWL